MKYLTIIIIILSIFFLNKLSAQPKSLDDLVEFRVDGVYAKETFTVVLPYWPHYTIQKGWKIATIAEKLERGE